MENFVDSGNDEIVISEGTREKSRGTTKYKREGGESDTIEVLSSHMESYMDSDIGKSNTKSITSIKKGDGNEKDNDYERSSSSSSDSSSSSSSDDSDEDHKEDRNGENGDDKEGDEGKEEYENDGMIYGQLEPPSNESHYRDTLEERPDSAMYRLSESQIEIFTSMYRDTYVGEKPPDEEILSGRKTARVTTVPIDYYGDPDEDGGHKVHTHSRGSSRRGSSRSLASAKEPKSILKHKGASDSSRDSPRVLGERTFKSKNSLKSVKYDLNADIEGYEKKEKSDDVKSGLQSLRVSRKSKKSLHVNNERASSKNKHEKLQEKLNEKASKWKQLRGKAEALKSEAAKLQAEVKSNRAISNHDEKVNHDEGVIKENEKKLAKIEKDLAKAEEKKEKLQTKMEKLESKLESKMETYTITMDESRLEVDAGDFQSMMYGGPDENANFAFDNFFESRRDTIESKAAFEEMTSGIGSQYPISQMGSSKLQSQKMGGKLASQMGGRLASLIGGGRMQSQMGRLQSQMGSKMHSKIQSGMEGAKQKKEDRKRAREKKKQRRLAKTGRNTDLMDRILSMDRKEFDTNNDANEDGEQKEKKYVKDEDPRAKAKEDHSAQKEKKCVKDEDPRAKAKEDLKALIKEFNVLQMERRGKSTTKTNMNVQTSSMQDSSKTDIQEKAEEDDWISDDPGSLLPQTEEEIEEEEKRKKRNRILVLVSGILVILAILGGGIACMVPMLSGGSISSAEIPTDGSTPDPDANRGYQGKPNVIDTPVAANNDDSGRQAGATHHGPATNVKPIGRVDVAGRPIQRAPRLAKDNKRSPISAKGGPKPLGKPTDSFGRNNPTANSVANGNCHETSKPTRKFIANNGTSKPAENLGTSKPTENFPADADEDFADSDAVSNHAAVENATPVENVPAYDNDNTPTGPPGQKHNFPSKLYGNEERDSEKGDDTQGANINHEEDVSVNESRDHTVKNNGSNESMKDDYASMTSRNTSVIMEGSVTTDSKYPSPIAQDGENSAIEAGENPREDRQGTGSSSVLISHREDRQGTEGKTTDNENMKPEKEVKNESEEDTATNGKATKDKRSREFLELKYDDTDSIANKVPEVREFR